jgi:hypothetical protein
MFPVGLGLKPVWKCTHCFDFRIIVACFGAFAKRECGRYYFFVLAMLLCKAHSESGYEYGKAKSNSLLYLYNADTGKANWATYKISIRGRKVTGENPKDAADLNEYPLFSKYNSGFTYATQPRKSCNTNYSIP